LTAAKRLFSRLARVGIDRCVSHPAMIRHDTRARRNVARGMMAA
jgi:hypothetical protein